MAISCRLDPTGSTADHGRTLYDTTIIRGGSKCTGKSLLIFRNMSSPRIKNISLHNSVNQNYNLPRPVPIEGRIMIVTYVGRGMRWTRSVRRARDRRAG